MANVNVGEISLYSLININGFKIPCFYCPDYTTSNNMSSDTWIYSNSPTVKLLGGYHKKLYESSLENYGLSLNTNGKTLWDVYVNDIGNGLNIYIGYRGNRVTGGIVVSTDMTYAFTLPSETNTGPCWASYGVSNDAIANINSKDAYLTDGKGNYIRAAVNINFLTSQVRSQTGFQGNQPSVFGPSSGWFTLDKIPGAKEVPPNTPDNPYEPGGDSGEGGGGGTFDDDSDPIPDSSLPTLSSAATGFTRIYNPTLAQLNQLATYLWTDESIIQTIWNHAKQFFEDPMSVIIGLNIVPVPVPNGGTENFKVLYIDTGIPLTYAASQFVDVDCGTLEIKRYYGSALDQAPYTKISCFLPFIGTVQLNTDEVMGATLQVKYRVDICSGSTVAKIFVDGNCIYQYSGHCAINVPVSSADFSSYVSAAISVAKLAIGAAVGGGMAALANAGRDPIQQTNNTTTITTTNTERNPATGRQITMGTQTQTIESVQQRPTTMASFSGLTPANVSNTVGEIMTAKPHVEHSGSFSGNTGYLGVRRPFVIIERPNMCMPASYQQFNGFPCMITLELAECSGFTKVQQVQLTGMSATNPEQAEILDLLKTGVIIQMFDIVCYQNKSPTNKVEKDIGTVISTLSGTLRAGASVIDPVILIQTDNNIAWLKGFNYCYVEAFGRYYYVTNIVAVAGVIDRQTEYPEPHHLFEIHCHVDVLMSYASEILAQKAVVARQESKYNLMLDDGFFMTYQNPKIQTKLFSVEGPFETQEFVLIVAGS